MKRSTLLLAALLASATAIACNGDVTGLGPPSDPATETFAPSLGVDISQMSKTAKGVYYSDIVVGTGAEVTDKTTTVKATYAVFLKDGKLIDSGTGVDLTLLVLVPGFADGIMGMKEGGKRKLVVPSALGYGGHSVRNADSSIKIPRQSTLIFDVEALKVTNPTTTTT